MKTVLGINSVPYGSTMRIMLGIEECAAQNGLKMIMSSGYSYHPMSDIPAESYVRVGRMISKLTHMLCSCLTGYNGCFSIISTLLFIKKVKAIQPDVINLHNIHGWYVNLPILFRYIKKHKIPVVWTLHDCWTFPYSFTLSFRGLIANNYS